MATLRLGDPPFSKARDLRIPYGGLWGLYGMSLRTLANRRGAPTRASSTDLDKSYQSLLCSIKEMLDSLREWISHRRILISPITIIALEDR